jgi:negative regulator of flagellin synthesis FlgM
MKVTETSQIRALAPSKPVEPGRATSAEHETSDRVTTADSARLQAAIAAASKGSGASRMARLQEIESAVRQGSYTPDPQRIADQILDEAELAARLQALFTK